MNKILLVGCGHMGSALLKAWHKKTAYSFTVIDPNKFSDEEKFNSKLIFELNANKKMINEYI